MASGAAVAALGPQPGDHCLDLCCAPGAKLCYISDLVGHTGTVTGVDCSRERLASCRTVVKKYGLPRARLFLCDGQNFDQPVPSLRAPEWDCDPEAPSVIGDTTADVVYAACHDCTGPVPATAAGEGCHDGEGHQAPGPAGLATDPDPGWPVKRKRKQQYKQPSSLIEPFYSGDELPRQAAANLGENAACQKRGHGPGYENGRAAEEREAVAISEAHLYDRVGSIPFECAVD